MRILKYGQLAWAALLPIVVSGCVVAMGNTEGLKHNSTTVGQELTDLKKAKDSGAITEDEYEMLKKKALERGKKG